MKNFEIIKKRRLAKNVCEYTIYAPSVARHCMAGQFVILRTDNDGERVPFTVCDYSRSEGTVRILVQEVGYTTLKLAEMKEGDALCDFVGPLGKPTDLSEYAKICLVGGGIGAAVIYPQAKQLQLEGKTFDVVLGAKNRDLLMYVDEFRGLADAFYPVTDDGSFGIKGFVTQELERLINGGMKYDCVFAVGPLPMMKAVCDVTRGYGIDTVVSMNTLMVDGTGMCGCCRVMLDGQVKYACIDGPEFDGHKIDFDEAMARGKLYAEHEHACRLRGGSWK